MSALVLIYCFFCTRHFVISATQPHRCHSFITIVTLPTDYQIQRPCGGRNGELGCHCGGPNNESPLGSTNGWRHLRQMDVAAEGCWAGFDCDREQSSILSPSHHTGTIAVPSGTHSAKKSGRAKAKQKQKGVNKTCSESWCWDWHHSQLVLLTYCTK